MMNKHASRWFFFWNYLCFESFCDVADFDVKRLSIDVLFLVENAKLFAEKGNSIVGRKKAACSTDFDERFANRRKRCVRFAKRSKVRTMTKNVDQNVIHINSYWNGNEQQQLRNQKEVVLLLLLFFVRVPASNISACLSKLIAIERVRNKPCSVNTAESYIPSSPERSFGLPATPR